MTATRSRLALAGLTVVALLVAGCGSGLSGPRAVLSSATSNIGTIRAGGLSVRFALTPNAAPADTVGIVIRGSFALDRRDRLPIANVAFTRLAGSESSTTRIDSNGQSATIGSASGRRVPLTTSQRQILAATVQGPQGLGNLPLHLDSWVANPHQTPGPVMGGQRTDEITGTVDLPSAINDLNQITGGQVTQAARSAAVDDALQKTLRSSSFLALVGHTDHLLRRLDLRVVLVPAGTPTTGRPTQGLTIVLRIALTPRPLAR